MSMEKSNIEFSGYRILGEIGRGAAAVVYKAEEISLNKIVAIKLLNPALFGDPASVERFIQEARTVARLRHAGIVPVTDLDEFEGRLFMVMEFMPGGDLTSWVRDHGLLGLRLIDSLARPPFMALTSPSSPRPPARRRSSNHLVIPRKAACSHPMVKKNSARTAAKKYMKASISARTAAPNLKAWAKNFKEVIE